MTEAKLIDTIVEVTDLPKHYVQQILAAEHGIIERSLLRGEEVKTPSVLLHSAVRETEVVDPKTGKRVPHKHVMIYVKARRAFRNKLSGRK